MYNAHVLDTCEQHLTTFIEKIYNKIITYLYQFAFCAVARDHVHTFLSKKNCLIHF